MSNVPGPTPADDYSDPERKRGARLVLAETGPAAVAGGVQGNFSEAFAIHLGASAMQIGILSAVIHLLVAVSQLSSVKLIHVLGGRRRMLVVTALMSALPFLLLALVPLAPSVARVWTLILLSALAVALTAVGMPAAGSLLTDLVHPGRRGRFLGLKSTIATAVSLAVGMAGAALLDGLAQRVVWGFVVVFLVAAAARLVSAATFRRIVDPRPTLKIGAGETPWRQLRQMGRIPLGKYNEFILVFHFAAGISAPVVALYLLRDLDVSYLWFAGLGAVSSLTTIMSNPIWGRVADFKSTALVLAISTGVLVLLPLLFVVSAQMWYLLLVFGIMGAGGAGWGISTYNFVLERSDEGARPAAVGSVIAAASIGMFAGALVGGAIAEHVPVLFSHRLLTVLLISFVLRAVTAAVLLPRAIGHTTPALQPTLVDSL